MKELPDFELKMYEQYPGWFEGLKQSSSESCLAWGFEIGEGWYPLIEELCAKIKEIVGDKEFVVEQVKEKFGGLRFYCQGGSSEVNDLIWKTEENSLKICEECGKPGKSRKGGWIKTVCDEHFQERQGKI
jgi:hypothetical protein